MADGNGAGGAAGDAAQQTPALRFGVLSTSSIVETALMYPCMMRPEAAVIKAIASRDPALAKSYKDSKGEGLAQATVYNSYQELIDKADVDCIYVPLPNSLHYEWTIKALEAGKHVLVEKPFCSNAEEAKAMVALAEKKGLVVMEAQHWYYHPVRARLQVLLQSGVLGTLQEISFTFRLKMGLPPVCLKRAGTFDTKSSSGKMWIMKEGMAGGISMTLGTYVMNIMRTLIGEEPEITSAEAQCLADDPELEAAMKGKLRFPKSGVEGSFDWTGMGPDQHYNEMTITGTEGKLYVNQLMEPQIVPNRIVITNLKGEETVHEVESGGLPTYAWQLLGFADNVRQVRSGASPTSFANTGERPVLQMEALDKCYLAAGMHPRWGPSGLLSKVRWPPGAVVKWTVVGGADKGGIIVRAGEDKESEQLAARLSTGAEVEELELKKDRLHFKKLTGDGPEEGWVSIKIAGKVLMQKKESPQSAPSTQLRKQMTGKPRVLCLHGTASGKAIMDIQYAKLWAKWGKDIDHYVLEAMKTCPNTKGAVSAEAVETMTKFFPGKPMMMYDELIFDERCWRCYKKVRDTLAWLQSMIKKHGPFDAVLGFSQGANFAVMLAAMSYAGTGKALSCVVAMCPNAPGYKDQLPELFEEPLPVPALIVRGEQEGYDEGVQRALKSKTIQKEGEEMCSAHVAKLFADPVLHTHSDGHRPMPSKPQEQDALVEKIISFVLDKATLVPRVKGQA